MTAPETSASAPLNPRLSELVKYVNETREQLETFVGNVPPSLQTARDKPEGWTVAEVIEHLAMIEDSVGRLISAMAKQLRAENAHETETSSVLGGLDQFGLPGTKSKLVAPESYRPTGTLSTAEALEKLRAIRTRVLEAVQKVNGLDLTKASFPHPYFGPMNGYQWLLMIGQHEMRHLNQMKDSIQRLTAVPIVSASAAPQGSH